MPNIDAAFAQRFAREWVDAWNRHDVEAVLAHYQDDFEFSSPIIAIIAGEPSGRLKGKAAIGAYWRAALAKLPELRFELKTVLLGAGGTITLYYQGNRGEVAETFMLDAATGLVSRAWACYAV